MRICYESLLVFLLLAQVCALLLSRSTQVHAEGEDPVEPASDERTLSGTFQGQPWTPFKDEMESFGANNGTVAADS